MSITWNGVNSDTIGVIVERIPNRYIPTRRFSPQQVAGRNGNILLVDKSFPNVEQEYEVYLSAESQGLPSVARACAEWLMGPDGYCRLEDSYDTTLYREAFLMGGYDLENILNKFGRCTITFSCKPQKYLLTGDTPVVIPAGTTDTYTGNPVSFDAITNTSITSLSVPITPTQDLHGYDHPWPAGGGKNLFDKDNPSVLNAYIGNTSITSSSSYRTVYIPCAPNTTYTASKIAVASGSSDRFAIAYTKEIPASGVAVYDRHAKNSGFVIGEEVSLSTTTDADAKYVVVWVSRTTGTEYEDSLLTLQIEVGATATDYAPYSNICPITGLTGLSVYVSPTQDPDDATVYNADWSAQAGTVYHGTVDPVDGKLTVDMANIPSYNGETINEPWLSSMDAYAPGTTPTIGAQVVYTLSTPITYQLTPVQIAALLAGETFIWASNNEPVTVEVATPMGGVLNNPTPFEARPLLIVSGMGEVVVNGKPIQILEEVTDFEIDCETMEAEDNSKIYCMDFPELSGGENEVVADGSITALSVVPRWWTL